MISNQDVWTDQDGTFNYPQFYYGVVELFEDDLESSWSIETLAWWQK
jgi:hypothetical protein